MTRGSRHKSHKQSKRSWRDYSDSEVDVKKGKDNRNNKEETVSRASRDSRSGEKRKLTSQSRNEEEQSDYGNGEPQEEYAASKRQKHRADVADGVGVMVVEKAVKRESSRRIDSERNSNTESNSKAKGSSDSKSRSSRRNETGGERQEGSVAEKEESKRGKVESKRKDVKEKDRDSGRKEVSQYKEKDYSKEKEKVRENKRDNKRDSETRVSSSEGREVKRGIENTEGPSQDELRNPQLEKELVKRNKRRDCSVENDKYQDDEKNSDDFRLSSRLEHAKEGRYKDGSYRDKYREDVDRENRHGDGKQREDVDGERRYREDKHRDERALRDHLSNKSDAKHTRVESNGAESRFKKSKTQNSNCDASPICEDRSTRYKDDKGKRSNDKEYQSDVRSQRIMEQCSDAEKKSINSHKVEIVTDRGRSHSDHADVDFNTSHNRWSSPASISHVAKDQFRLLKQVESKYRDSVPEERLRRVSPKEITGLSGAPEKASVSWPMEKHLNKNDSHLDELSHERCPNSDPRSSPMQLVENSTSSMSADCKHRTRAGVGRYLDVEESGQRSGGGTSVAKDIVGNEVRASQEFSMDIPSVDVFSQADGDNLSTSSPLSRTSNLRSNSRSIFPPPPHFRSVVDSTSKFGSSEEDSRGKSNYRFKRTGDFNMGRARGNARKGAPNWPSAVTNSFIPFQHGPPPVGFHPVMQQFSAPPIFGVRRSMEYNHPGVPYHFPDADRFSSHGCPFGWQNPLDDSHLPLLQGWDAKNGVIEGEVHVFGSLDQDHDKNLMSSQGWETNIDMWKGQSGGLTMELRSALQKEDHSVRAPAEEIWAGKSSQEVDVQNQVDLQAENIDSGRSTDTLAKETSETPQSITDKTPSLTKTSRDDDARLRHVYLSKLDISADLTYPELYNQCRSLMDEQNRVVDEDASKPLYLEEVIEARVRISSNTSNASLFAAISDSVFQRAMSFYKKQKEEMRAIFLPSLSNGEKVPFYSAENLDFVPICDQEKAATAISFWNGVKSGELVPTLHGQDTWDAIPNSNQEKPEMSTSSLKLKMPHATPYERADEPVPANSLGSLEEPFRSLHAVEINVDKVVNQETSNGTIEDTFSTVKESQFTSLEPGYTEDFNETSNSRGNHSANGTEEQKLVDIKRGHLPFSDVSSESGSVNLSRILHSPESTH